MTLRFCGYFPKRATPRPEGYDLPGVVEIASISDCIARRGLRSGGQALNRVSFQEARDQTNAARNLAAGRHRIPSFT